MDFLILMIAYGVTFGSFSYILLLGDSNFHRNGVIGKIRQGLLQTVKWVHRNLLPRAVQRLVNRFINYLIHERNPFFQYLYVIVLLLALYYYTVDVLPLALAVGNPAWIIFVSYFWFTSCLVLFIICCKSDPGVITMETLHRFRDVYDMDCVLYHRGAECRTCKFEKPARSKHCGTCNHCVYRFDHHCTWLNNCIGGFNHRYFLALVTSLCLGTGFVSYSILSTLSLFAQVSGLLEASYVGPDGKLWPVTLRVAAQHLFMERPMPVFIMMSLALLSLLVAAFMFYHVYLALTNQTTNERYKRSQAVQEIRQHCNCSSSRNAKTVSQHKNSHSKRNHSRQADVIPLCKNIYDKGFVWNLYEILFPVSNR
ncbi:probable palmitoyltransferase ZDHHC4 [Strongylocentrotus purpuratus]|uniref:Palmitoyltransferase n=1 Tax=Strongylocentrotus purpuratus TaxID=7668 RepID=A0A7M7NR88_STRPU|nr:probable palmitoyltransferase ZDHHC4 [Strongylocentrotus purpuratus]XP_030840326.1 probable palmitoyltransferase ZDHHC4 [Strongylocentrotus purpuratus]